MGIFALLNLSNTGIVVESQLPIMAFLVSLDILNEPAALNIPNRYIYLVEVLNLHGAVLNVL